MQDHYKILGITNTANETTIKSAYRSLALLYHPDINKSPNATLKFIEINEAYETLIDNAKRAAYDYQLLQCNTSTYSKKSTANKPKEKHEKGHSVVGYMAIVFLSMIARLPFNNNKLVPTINYAPSSQYKDPTIPSCLNQIPMYSTIIIVDASYRPSSLEKRASKYYNDLIFKNGVI